MDNPQQCNMSAGASTASTGTASLPKARSIVRRSHAPYY